MSASDDLSRMLAAGRQNDALLNQNSATGNFASANNYYDAVMSNNPSAEEPNDWAKMLMSLAQQNNSWSADQAMKQMEFQERMSNTAHVREIADLKAAGLNPVLSAKLGGASTPVGAQGTTDTSITGSIVQLMNKMLDVEQSNAQMQLTRELANMSGSGSGSGYGLLGALLNMLGLNQKEAEVIEGVLNESGATDKFLGAVGSIWNVAKDIKGPSISKKSDAGLSSKYGPIKASSK